MKRFTRLAVEHNKRFEFIQIKGNVEQTKLHGKSYGECELINSFVDQSSLLKGESCFYKVTGRVIVKNINRLIDNKSETRFVCNNSYGFCVTSFFKLTLDDHSGWLRSAIESVDEESGQNIERVTYRMIGGRGVRVRSFRPYPNQSGVIAGTGGGYDKGTPKLIVFNALSMLGFFDYRALNSWQSGVIEHAHRALNRVLRIKQE